MDHSKKKPFYPISDNLHRYLVRYGREESIPISYEDLLDWTDEFTVYDSQGNDTLWKSVIYGPGMQAEVDDGLKRIYASLKTDGNMDVIHHLSVSRIDYCLFGNSNPFRIRIVNNFNDNHDYFYIKKADASRVFGLEFEHILSPNRIAYLLQENTLVEEHIPGIPGDIFLETYMDSPNFYAVGMAKEFVKFNERCFVMLLGDMRSYNYVIDVTPDFDKEQYRARPIDFDQFCYEGRKNNYRPQFYKENSKVVHFCMEILSPETVNQYQFEERSLMKKRYIISKKRISLLMECLSVQHISTPEKRKSLCVDLNQFHNTTRFNRLRSMGSILRLHMDLMLDKPRIKKPSGNVKFKKKKSKTPRKRTS